MNWKDLFKKPQNKLEGAEETTPVQTIPCPICGKNVSRRILRDNFYVCPICGGYFRINPRQRLRLLCDDGSFKELFCDIKRNPPFDFPGYDEKLSAAEKKSNEYDSVTTGECLIGGIKTMIFVMNCSFMMGSMGQVTGEHITRCFEYAMENKLPVIGVTVSGGARMQEGIISLMQMAKVNSAIKRHSDAGLLYMTLLTDPTTGGVSASLAMAGDIIIAEPKALICFAGPRVIEQTLRQKLPADFAKAETLLHDGLIDDIVPRSAQKDYITSILTIHGGIKV